MLCAASVLAWREARYRSGVAAVVTVQPAGAALPEPVPPATAPLALALGFVLNTQVQAGSLQLALKACFTSSAGDAWALVGSAEGNAVYRVGDRLPGGAVLRRVDGQSITLWVNGRELQLGLHAGAATVFQPSAAQPPAAALSAPSPRLLRKVH